MPPNTFPSSVSSRLRHTHSATCAWQEVAIELVAIDSSCAKHWTRNRVWQNAAQENSHAPAIGPVAMPTVAAMFPIGSCNTSKGADWLWTTELVYACTAIVKIKNVKRTVKQVLRNSTYSIGEVIKWCFHIDYCTGMKKCCMRAPAMAMTALSRLSAAVCCRYTVHLIHAESMQYQWVSIIKKSVSVISNWGFSLPNVFGNQLSPCTKMSAVDTCRYYIKECTIPGCSIYSMFSIVFSYTFSIANAFGSVQMCSHVQPGNERGTRILVAPVGRSMKNKGFTSWIPDNMARQTGPMLSNIHVDSFGQMPTRTKLPIYTYLLASFDQINLPTYTTGASKVYNLFLFPLRRWIKNNRVIVKAIYKETLETPSSHLYNAKATCSPQLPQNPPDSRIHSLKALIKFGSSWRKINLI